MPKSKRRRGKKKGTGRKPNPLGQFKKFVNKLPRF